MPRDHAFSIPSDLRESFAGTDDGDRWLAALPSLVDKCEEQWDIRTGEPFVGGVASWCAPATRADGTDVVIKLAFPEREAREEGTALRFWDGDGAVLLLHEDREHFALLIERCRPGTTLRDADLPVEDALTIGAELLGRLWREQLDPSDYELVADVAAERARDVRERAERRSPPFDAGLVELGASLLESLPAWAARSSVVVHGDYNPGNVLAAAREPWLVIDPQPMIGDRAYDPSPLLLQIDDPFAHGDPPEALAHRFAFVGDLVGEDPRRIFAWAVAREVDYAMWEWNRGQDAKAQGAMERVAVLARVGEL